MNEGTLYLDDLGGYQPFQKEATYISLQLCYVTYVPQ